VQQSHAHGGHHRLLPDQYANLKLEPFNSDKFDFSLPKFGIANKSKSQDWVISAVTTANSKITTLQFIYEKIGHKDNHKYQITDLKVIK